MSEQKSTEPKVKEQKVTEAKQKETGKAEKPKQEPKTEKEQGAKKTANSPNNQPKKKEQEVITRAIIKREISIGSHAAQKMYLRLTRYLARKLFNITVFSPVLTGSSEKSEEFDGLLDKYFDDTEKWMKDGFAQTQELLRANEVNDKAEYTGRAVHAVEIDTPYIMRFLNCIKLMDEYVSVVETCWMLGLITSTQRNLVIQTARKRINTLSSQIGSVEKRAFDAVKRMDLVETVIQKGAITEEIELPDDDEEGKKAA